MPVIARELLQNHTNNIFSERMKTIFGRKKIFYPIEKDKEREKGKKGNDDSD
jgi:hypothetical protein